MDKKKLLLALLGVGAIGTVAYSAYLAYKERKEKPEQPYIPPPPSPPKIIQPPAPIIPPIIPPFQPPPTQPPEQPPTEQPPTKQPQPFQPPQTPPTQPPPYQTPPPIVPPPTPYQPPPTKPERCILLKMLLSTRLVYWSRVQLCENVSVIGHGYEAYPTLKPRAFLYVNGVKYDIPYVIDRHNYKISLQLTVRNGWVYWNDIKLCPENQFRPKAINAATVRVFDCSQTQK